MRLLSLCCVLPKERAQQKKKAWFRRLQNFRAGSEARISLLKRKFSLGRTLSQRSAGAEGWIGWGVLSQNLWQMARAR